MAIDAGTFFPYPSAAVLSLFSCRDLKKPLRGQVGGTIMRLWTLHPKYLDRAGLLALWREALLAQAVLRGETRGYRNHPQLIRFRNHPEPPAAIGAYLTEILGEAVRRGYRFNQAKIAPGRNVPAIPVTRGQLLYERYHLLGKLAVRDCAACLVLTKTDEPDPHPLFTICEGEVETWERVPAAETG
jgi:hypothetical protein